MVNPTAAQLAEAGPAPRALTREYTQVPDSLPDVVLETAEQVTKGSANDYERAVKLQDWFASQGGFTYDTKVNSGTGTEAITRFLKDKQGFCVHFSFTMAAMARTLGIPARVAVGFTPARPSRTVRSPSGCVTPMHGPSCTSRGGLDPLRADSIPGSTPSYTWPDTPSGDTSDPSVPSAGASEEPSAAPSSTESCPAQLGGQGECGASTAPGWRAPQTLGRRRAPSHWWFSVL
ncbi:transglutaminase-like domain-containing protein [Streptomyces sp. M10(2022)]